MNPLLIRLRKERPEKAARPLPQQSHPRILMKQRQLKLIRLQLQKPHQHSQRQCNPTNLHRSPLLLE